MKKVLSFVLVLSLVLSSFSMAFAGTASDVAGKDCEVAVGALTELGVVSGYEDGSYRPDNAVNRAEAATLVVRALGLGEYAGGNTSSFTDLAGYEWAEGYIGYAEALGILNGDGNGKFRPGDEVTYQELAKMLVAAVGYTPESLPGTWPSNYVVKAKALGILDGITKVGNMAANRGDVAIMIYNNLDNPLGYVNLDNQWVPNVDVLATGLPADTMLARLDRAVYDVTVDVTANDTTVDVRTNGDIVFVYDGSQAVAEGVNIEAYLGAAVIAYANNDNEITGIKEVASAFVSGEFSVASDGTVVLTLADETEYKLNGSYGLAGFTSATAIGTVIPTLDSTVMSFENGSLANGDTTNITLATTTVGALDDMTFAVAVKGNYISKIYSVTEWSADEVFFWDEDLAEGLEDDAVIGSHEFALTKKDEINTEYFALVGAKSLDDIKADDVVTVYTNGTYITRVEVCNKVIEGTITKVNAAGNKYTINGEAYKKSGVTGVDNGDVTLGAEGKFYLDYSGKVAFTDVVADSADTYAIVTVIGGDDSTFDSTVKKVKLFTSEGNDTIFNINKKVTNAAASVMDGVNELVAYDLNKDGEVTTAVALNAATTAATKYTAKGLMDGYRLASDVVVFAFDSSMDWSIASVKDIPVDEDLSGDDVWYYYNTVSEKIEVVILGPKAAAEDSSYGVIVDYASVKDGDDTVFEVEILVDGVTKKVLTDTNSGTMATTLGATTLVEFAFEGDILVNATPIVTTGVAVEKIETEGVRVTGAALDYYDYKTGTAGESTANVGSIVDVADDVVVYFYDVDNGFSVSKLSAIKKGYTVYMYQMDKEDAEVDVIYFTK